MIFAGGSGIDACRIDTGVTEDVGEIENIFIFMIIRSCEEMTEVMRKNLFGVDAGDFGDLLHFRPDITAVERVSFLGQKNRTVFDFPALHVLRELLSELLYDEDLPAFSLTAHIRTALLHSFDRDVPKLTNPDAGAGDRFHHERNLLPSLLKRGLHEPEVLLLLQLLPAADEHLLLTLKSTYTAFFPAEVVKVHIDGHQHTVHTAGLIALGQRVLILDHPLLRHRPISPQPAAELSDIPEVLLDRRCAFLHLQKIKSILADILYMIKLSHPAVLLSLC